MSVMTLSGRRSGWEDTLGLLNNVICLICIWTILRLCLPVHCYGGYALFGTYPACLALHALPYL